MRSYAWIMAFQQHYLTLVPGLRFRWHPIGVVEWPPPPRAGYPGGRYPGKTLVLEKLGVKVQGGLGEVQNEDWGSKRSLPPRAAYHRGIRLGREPVVVIGIFAPFTPRGVGIPGKLLFSRSRGVNAFVCMDNGLPAALPPRFKIPMAPHWCCRVIPRGSVSWENNYSREIGG